MPITNITTVKDNCSSEFGFKQSPLERGKGSEKGGHTDFQTEGCVGVIWVKIKNPESETDTGLSASSEEPVFICLRFSYPSAF